MPYFQKNAVVFFACFCAGLAGMGIVFAWEEKRRYDKRQFSLQTSSLNAIGMAQGIVSAGFVKQLLCFMIKQSFLLKLKPGKQLFAQGIWGFGLKHYLKIITKTGLKEKITQTGFFCTRAYICLLSFCFCSLMGAVFSNELMLLLALSGAILGWHIPLWALKKEKEARTDDLENCLSEMLEVITLGLRSGLPFDRSFELYHCHFSTNLAQRCASVQHCWQLGLESREESLRGLAAEYDSSLFLRIIENIIRSLRFGAALAESLGASALEARMIHKAHREEAVAKAPVKMLLPTATLILPAMLLLVLGPILLDMMQGF